MRYLESKIQKAIVKAGRLLFPRSILLSVPNGGQRNKITAAILKSEGALAGVSDLIFIHEGKVYFIEVKTDKGKQTDSQKEFQQKVQAQGFEYIIMKSTDDFLSRFDSPVRLPNAQILSRTKDKVIIKDHAGNIKEFKFPDGKFHLPFCGTKPQKPI